MLASARMSKTLRAVSGTAAAGHPLTTNLSVGPHDLVADEPVELGGDDLGPGPTEMLLASLAACTNMTLRMYARRKEYPLDDVRVHLVGEVGADGLTIRRVIELEGALTDEQREAILRIADKCPVHKILTNGAKIVGE